MTEERAESHPILEEVLAQYPVGSARSLTRIAAGLIHETFLVQTPAGRISVSDAGRISHTAAPSAGSARVSDAGRYVLQRLHPDMASDGILADYFAVTEHLADRAFPSPRLVPTVEGRFHVDRDNRRYRLITYVPGVSRDFVVDCRMAREAARMLGSFHVAMGEFRHAFISGRPLHDSPGHHTAFQAAVRKHGNHPLMPECRDMVNAIDEFLPNLFLPHPLPSRVVHGDPKISNVLFDVEGRQAIGLVDLDSCGRHTALVDIGDAVRSWCRDGPEDFPSPFLPDRFRAVCEGYAQSGAALSGIERKHIVQSCRLITLELGSRFLRDVFEDRYFGWDCARFASRSAHNLARARGCVALYESMAAQEGEMERIVREVRR